VSALLIATFHPTPTIARNLAVELNLRFASLHFVIRDQDSTYTPAAMNFRTVQAPSAPRLGSPDASPSRCVTMRASLRYVSA